MAQFRNLSRISEAPEDGFRFSMTEDASAGGFGAARLQWGGPSLYRLGGLADFLARFGVEALRAPLGGHFGARRAPNGLQGGPERLHGEPRNEIAQTSKPVKRWPSPL